MPYHRTIKSALSLFGSLMLVIISTNSFAEGGHKNMGHGADRGKAALSESGQDAFGTIQEAIQKLQADPDTNWKKVNLEGLRQHLIDMDNFTMKVSVIEKKNIKSGVELRVRPDSARARKSLETGLSAHPRMLKMETGWVMTAKKAGSDYVLKITSPNKKDADQIRGLGYIGVMALGDHHQAHHWAMATGGNPHH